jgi:hypothetical protein
MPLAYVRGIGYYGQGFAALHTESKVERTDKRIPSVTVDPKPAVFSIWVVLSCLLYGHIKIIVKYI